MKILKKVLLSVFFVVIFSISLFIIQLFLNEKAIEVTYFSTMGILLLVLIYGLFQLISGRPKSKDINRRLAGFITVVMAIVLGTSSTVISALNISIYYARDIDEAAQIFGLDDRATIGVSEKIQAYSTLKDLVGRIIKSDIDLGTMMEAMEKEEYEHLEIYYYKDMDSRPIDVVKRSFQKTEEIVEDIFGKVEKNPVNVIFYNDRKTFFSAFMGEEIGDLQGFYNPSSGIHINKFEVEASYSQIESLFRHEYAHHISHIYKVENKINPNLPAWFEEGLATYIGDEGMWEYSLSYIKDAGSLREIDTHAVFNKLSSQIDYSKGEIYDPYMHGYYAVDYLVKEIGEDSIRKVILKTKDIDFYDAFEEIAGVDIDRFSEEVLIDYIETKSEEQNR